VKTARREPLGRATKAFTLIELLAVIGIMLLLMTGVFGVFSMLAQQAGPEAAVSTLQAMLNSARDYAASNGVDTQVVFSVDTTKGTSGTTMALQYYETDPAKVAGWYYVRGRKPYSFQDRIYICKGMPSSLASPPDHAADPAKPTQAEIGSAKGWLTSNGHSVPADESTAVLVAWNAYRQDLLQGKPSENGWGGVTGHALDTVKKDGTLNSTRVNFNVPISPTGYITTVGGFTVVQVGGTRVVGYVFYPLNPNTGTRLLFE